SHRSKRRYTSRQPSVATHARVDHPRWCRWPVSPCRQVPGLDSTLPCPSWQRPRENRVGTAAAAPLNGAGRRHFEYGKSQFGNRVKHAVHHYSDLRAERVNLSLEGVPTERQICWLPRVQN